MVSSEALQLVSTAAVAVAVLSGGLFVTFTLLVHVGLAGRLGAAVMGADADHPTGRWAAWLARLFLAVCTTAGLVALVADHPAVWRLAPGAQ